MAGCHKGMKRLLPYIAFVAVVGLMVWLFSRRVDSDAVTQPRVEKLAGPAGELSLDKLKGNYVLVNFWDSSNAVSRIATAEYDRFFRSHPGEGIEMVSVNTDDDRGMYSEIARKDGLDLSRQFHIMDVKSGNLGRDYKAHDGFMSYLMNPSGKIVAKNPSVETLEKYLSPVK